MRAARILFLSIVFALLAGACMIMAPSGISPHYGWSNPRLAIPGHPQRPLNGQPVDWSQLGDRT